MKASVFIGMSVDCFIARANGDLDAPTPSPRYSRARRRASGAIGANSLGSETRALSVAVLNER